MAIELPLTRAPYVAQFKKDDPIPIVCKRPSISNVKGTAIPLFVNWYRLECGLTNSTIYQYDIVVSNRFGRKQHEEKNSEKKRKAFWHCVRNNGHIFGPLNEIIYDDKSAFSLNPWRIQSGHQRFEIKYHKNQCVSIRIKYISRFNFDLNAVEDDVKILSRGIIKSIIHQRLQYHPADNDEEWEFINNWTVHSGSIYYIPRADNDPKVFIDAGVRAWLGVYASAKVLQDRNPALALGLVNRLFYEMNMSLVEFYCEVIGELGLYRRGDSNFKNILRNKGMNQWQRNKANKLLNGTRLKTTEILVSDRKSCYRFAERRATFVELCNCSAMSAKMPQCCNRHRQYTMAEIYNMLGKRLEFPWLPVCRVKTGNKLHVAPLEVLHLHDKPQRYSKMLSENMRMEFIKKVCREPHLHKQLIENIFRMMEFDSAGVVNFLNGFRVGVVPRMIQCSGTVLDSPIAIDKERNEVPMTDQRAIKKKELNETPAGEVVSAVIILSNRDGTACVSQDQAGKVFILKIYSHQILSITTRRFFDDLVKKCRERGLRMADEPLRVYNNVSAENFEKCVEDSVIRFNQLEGEPRVREGAKKILLVLIINDRAMCVDDCATGQDLYGFIKLICDNSRGVASQVIDAATVVKATSVETKTIYYNIALKINAKLGGVNQAVVFDYESRSAECPAEDAVIYVGIDVTHPTNDNDYDISIACMVANIDLAATRYKSKIFAQMRKRETVESFDVQFRQLMLSFKEHSRVWPRHVIILRDGVSDSEMVRTASIELSWIRKSWEFLTGNNPETIPTYTYIVIQKRHITRFYQPTQDKDGHETYVNVPSGTVIDEVVVSPNFFDFYLASQIGAIGTTRPAHYTVVFDEWGLSADKIYEICYRLCFLYARCRIPVSLPCPVYYSHRVCEKAKEVYKTLYSRNAFDGIVDDELRKIEIEKQLSVPDHYPGMHFV